MATAVQNLRLTTGRCANRSACQAYIGRAARRNQSFSSSATRAADEGKIEASAKVSSNATQPISTKTTDGGHDARASNNASTAGSVKSEALLATIRAQARKMMLSDPDLMQARSRNRLRIEPKRAKPGFLNLGEKPGDAVEDPEFEMDDVSSIAHTELEQHREFREYARIAAWEMPLLTKLAKPFVPPSEKQVLRFRYTTYMGEEHPAEKKVVVEFSPADMPNLTSIQREKLKKLAGVRYNPETDIVKMSCEMFETQAQNKRYLGDVVDTLLNEARDPKDDFADVPLDTRHHTFKAKPKFPVEWRMTEQRQKELQAVRQQAQLTDQQRALEGAIVDGVQQIRAALRQKAVTSAAEPVPEMIPSGKGKAKGGKKVAVRR